MRKKVYSLQGSVRYILGVMGVLGVVLVLISVSRYRQVVYAEQQRSLGTMVQYQVDERLRQHEAYLSDLGVSMQADRDFRTAHAKHEIPRLKTLINDQFRQYFTTLRLVDLRKIVIFDLAFTPLVESDAYRELSGGEGICSHLIQRAKARTGTERLKIITDMCHFAGKPLHMAILPVGGLQVSGYIGVIADPVNLLQSLNTTLGMPIKVVLPDGEDYFISTDWSSIKETKDVVPVVYTVENQSSTPQFSVHAASDVTGLNEKMFQVTASVSLVGLVITVLAITLTMLILKKTVTMPLAHLNRHMRDVRENRASLEEHVEIIGCEELNTLAMEFNGMATRLAQLQKELELQAHTDELTGLPNRALFYDRMQQQLELSRRHESGFIRSI